MTIRTTTASYINHFTGETYRLVIVLKAQEAALEAAWGRGFRVMQSRMGWCVSDVSVRVH